MRRLRHYLWDDFLEPVLCLSASPYEPKDFRNDDRERTLIEDDKRHFREDEANPE